MNTKEICENLCSYDERNPLFKEIFGESQYPYVVANLFAK